MMNVEFPAAADGDPGDVVLALQTANALWKQGDAADALRWLRRAAEAAEGEGKDDRALSLARAAAELRDSGRVHSTPPPPPSRRPPPSVPAPPPRVALPPAVARATLDEMPTPAYGAPVPAPVTPVGSVPPRPSSAVPPPEGRSRSGPPSVAHVAETRAALRVAVEVLSPQSGTLRVRILGEGEELPAGTQEALLVPTAPGVDLRQLPSRRA